MITKDKLMANNDDYKPLNPTARLKEGRLAGVCFFANKTFSTVLPNYRETITLEDRESGLLENTFNGKKYVTLLSSEYKNGWSFIRRPGQYDPDTIVILMGMPSREANSPVPLRLFVFAIKDIDTATIETKVGPRDISSFRIADQDKWEMFSCHLPEIGKSLRSLESGTIDPDLPNGPFRSHLTALITGTTSKPESADDSKPEGESGDWTFDENLPF